jgi:tyrosyl-tRNA synthetase
MGKTAEGAIWLNAERLPAYDYWQFWRDCADADVGRFLRLFTLLPIDEIKRLEGLEGTEINEAKKVLATEATALGHGREAAETAAETARRTFERGGHGDDLPTLEVSRGELEAGIAAYELLCRAGLTASNGEARRLIKGGGGRLNNRQIADETAMVGLADSDEDGSIKLSAGKKRHALVRVVD